MIQEGLKFYFPVTHNIGIRRAPGTILVQKVLEHIVPVLAGEINRVQRNIETITYLLSVRQIFARRTVFLGRGSTPGLRWDRSAG